MCRMQEKLGYMKHQGQAAILQRLRTLCREGQLDAALDLVEDGVCRHHHHQLPIPTMVFYCLIQGCIQKMDLNAGKRLHSLVVKNRASSSCALDSFLGSHLIRMFSSCGDVAAAGAIFDSLQEPTAFSWSAIIQANVRHGRSAHAISLYRRMMQHSSIRPDGHVFVAALKACSDACDIFSARSIHASTVEEEVLEPTSEGVVANALIDMYHRCGCLADAFSVFESRRRLFSALPPPPDVVVAWNSMISGFSSHGLCHEAYELLTQMRACGLEPNLVTWNTVLSGYALTGDSDGALRTLERMKVEAIQPDCVSFTSVLKACGGKGALEQGRLLHMEMVKMGMAMDARARNALMDMYLRCGGLEEARAVVAAEAWDVAAWTSMVGYGEMGVDKDHEQVGRMLQEMGMGKWKEMDAVAVSSVLKASSVAGAVEQGRLVHAYATERGTEEDEYVVSAAVDMYGKCGNLECACAMLVGRGGGGVAAWTAMMGGLAAHGEYEAVLRMVQCMMAAAAATPNSATLLSLLVSTAWGRGLGDARAILDSMGEWFGVEATEQHQNCCAHLLGSAGHLQEAEQVLLLRRRSVAEEDYVRGWVSLLSNSLLYGDAQVGRRCMERLGAAGGGDWRRYEAATATETETETHMNGGLIFKASPQQNNA